MSRRVEDCHDGSHGEWLSSLPPKHSPLVISSVESAPVYDYAKLAIIAWGDLNDEFNLNAVTAGENGWVGENGKITLTGETELERIYVEQKHQCSEDKENHKASKDIRGGRDIFKNEEKKNTLKGQAKALLIEYKMSNNYSAKVVFVGGDYRLKLNQKNGQGKIINVKEFRISQKEDSLNIFEDHLRSLARECGE